MEKTIEFKIRVPDVKRWGDTPVYLSKPLSGTAAEIEQDAQEIAEGIAFSQHSEVRWNYRGEDWGRVVDEVFPDEKFVKREERILLLPDPDLAGVAAD